MKNKVRAFIIPTTITATCVATLSPSLLCCGGHNNTPIVEPDIIIDSWHKDEEVSYLDLTVAIEPIDKNNIYSFVIDASKFEWTARYNTSEFAVKPVSTDYLTFNVLSISSSKTGKLRKVAPGVVQNNSFYIEQSQPHFIVHINHNILNDDLIAIMLEFNDDYSGNDAYAYFRNQE